MAKKAPRKQLSAQATPRPDGLPKVAGTAVYVDDLEFAGMLHAAVATSPIAHGRLRGVSTDEAEALEGVHCVLVADDIEGENSIGVSAGDQPLLAVGKVRWKGDRLALVAAETPFQARAAAGLVQGSYDELEPVFDMVKALEADAPILHEKHKTGNLAAKGCVYKGNVKKALRKCDVVIENTYTFGMQEHAYLETQGCVAVPQTDGSMTIYASMQCPFYVQDAIAKVLAMPLSMVRVVQTVTGGAFGGKEDYPSEPAACAALLARKTGRPVKLILNRAEDISWSSKREAQHIVHRIGAMNDGTIVAMDIDLTIDAGAYLGLAAVVAERGNASIVGPYNVPHVRVDTRTVYTCNAFSGAFRGFGHPQVAVATEAQIDELACQLAMDPVDVRRMNLLRPGDVAPTGEVLHAPVEAGETLDAAVKLADYKEMRLAIDRHNATETRTRWGLGVSTISYGCCLHAGGQFLEGAGSLLQLHKDGAISVAVGNTEMGQGSAAVLAEIVATELGCAPERVHVKTVDTDLVPDSGPTVASRTTTMSGMAVVDACRKLRQELLSAAAHHLSVPEKKVVLGGDGVTLGGRKKLTYAELAQVAFHQKRNLMANGWYAPPRKVWDPKTGQGQPYSAYAYATMIALCEIDTFTGRTRVKRVACAHDVGAAIYLPGATGQIEGGVVQGMGYAIMERCRQVEGSILNANFTDYIIPSALDAPQIDIALIESRDIPDGQAGGPYGAKGLGEPSLIPICAAIGNAIRDAVGVRVTTMPFMPERVLDALEASGTGASGLSILPSEKAAP